MQTAREYAISLGLAKPGRGKLSFAAHEALQKAIANGMTFSDYPKETNGPKPVHKKVRPSKPAKEDTTGIAELAPYRFPENAFKAVQGNGIVRSLREACRTCRVSLVGHYCENPQIVALDGSASVPVKIVAL